jgi:hypothetical protein
MVLPVACCLLYTGLLVAEELKIIAHVHQIMRVELFQVDTLMRTKVLMLAIWLKK